MQFNIGDKKFRPTYKDSDGKIRKAWPNLFDAIAERDWEKAAHESERGDVGHERNLQIFDWLMHAAGQEKKNTRQ